MDTENLNVRPHSGSRRSAKNHPPRRPHGGRTDAPSSGVVHDNARHTTRFTVIGNHLAQHPDLSLLAIGLGCHIQSLPTGARVDIKSLAARFPEGPARIAAALRELEAHGYLRRTRERTESGRIITRTVSCNQPNRRGTAAPEPPPPRPAPRPPARRTALPAVPKPVYVSPALLRTATDVLTSLRRTDPRLLLTAADTEHLAPGVVAWLERDLTPAAVRHALTTGLPPDALHRPAALLAHRLTALLPPLPFFRAPEPPPPVRHPLQNCDGCDRAFRAPSPGHCPGCRPAHTRAP